jgi:TonB family protein
MAGDWLYLMIKAAFCLGVFYLVYVLLLKNETFFHFNRLYLVITVLFAMIIPMVHIRLPELSPGSGNPYMLDLISVGSWFIEETIPETQKPFQVFLILYLAGCALFLAVFLVRICRLIALIHWSGIHRIDGWKLIFNSPGNRSPFSFMDFVFISREEFRSDAASRILMHERVHISQRHSLDLLLIEIIAIMQWFNPFIWLYRRSVVQQHEYLADQGVIRHYGDILGYQGMLLHISSSMNFHTLTHPFSHSLLKRRFIMMSKSKSLPRSRWKMVAVIPVITVLLLFFKDVSGRYTEQMLSWSQPSSSRDAIEYLTALTGDPASSYEAVIQSSRQTSSDTVYTVVEEMPAFKGGQSELINYISSNIHYPQQAKEQGITGTVFITFLIDEVGKVRDVKVLRGIGGGCDEEALRVVQAMPDWNPGKSKGVPVKVSFNLPIKFNLNKEAVKDSAKDTKPDVNKDIDPK